MDPLNSNAEQLAERAEALPAFSGLKLSHVKQQLTKLLSLIGRDGIFDEYTSHDISHINKMLGMLDWLIPADTKPIMSAADWLLTVLAIYFHDLGMLVTKKEYELRNSSDFPTFKAKDLFAGDKGKDYAAKVETLGSDRAERFAYQEFVRSKHAERIRAWILGVERTHLGISSEVLRELDKLLSSLTPQFRKDLAIVCESHHLNDLDDFKKYRTSQPYGDSDQETANVQYCAILMRTADLLHVTSDRTPSISYRVINPTDPISQEEWAKQMAVRRVRAQVGRDKEGIPDEGAPKDTIEVYADFKSVDGFFGLTSYLLYAASQLQRSFDWAQEANKTQGAKHRFPWRYLDDSHIETEGFIKETFEFTFDQPKILDLLTGHTLYDDSKIVLRELVQNSIDAVRLQRLIDAENRTESVPGIVRIFWNSASRILTVQDSGTGMTQSIIERNLLRVGSSRYQGEEFKAEFPQFSSISRFGIGVLSTFMIADSVEIVTCHPDDEKARQLSLRSVHGKYLIRLLDKYDDELATRLAPHGTRFDLKIRHSVDMSDILETAQRWIALPDCIVELSIDGQPATRIGFTTPKEAVESYLRSLRIPIDDQAARRRIRVLEEEVDGVRLAYAVEWSEYFKEWSFMRAYRGRRDNEPLLGTCLEGIRVEFNTPGFNGYNIVALANASGVNAPKTNVARSGLEATPERDRMLSIIYSVLCRHIENELRELSSTRGFSKTWAVQESGFLLSPLIDTFGGTGATSRPLFDDQIRKLPIILIERDGRRSVISPAEFQKESTFWTIDCESFRSAEDLLREMAGNASLSALLGSLGSESFHLPKAPFLCGNVVSRKTEQFLYADREVVSIRVDHQNRRVDLEWGQRTTPPRWREFPANIEIPIADNELIRSAEPMSLRVGSGALNLDGISSELAVQASRYRYLLPNSPVSQLLLRWLDLTVENSNSRDIGQSCFFLFCIVSLFLNQHRTPTDANELRQLAASMSFAVNEEVFGNDVIQIINDTKWILFDSRRWQRTSQYAW